MERTLAEGLDRIYAQMLEQRRHVEPTVYECDACEDSFMVYDEESRTARPCGSPVHVKHPVPGGRTEFQ